MRLALIKPGAIASPILAAHCEQIYYKVNGPQNTTYFRPQSTFVGQRDHATDVLWSLSKKRATAAAFDSGKHPLWLLLTLADDAFDITGSLRDAIRIALESANLAPFDRVLVELPEGPPVYVDRRDA